MASKVWLRFNDAQEPFRIEVNSDSVIDDIKESLLKEPYIRKFSPQPLGTMDIQLLQISTTVAPDTLVSSLHTTASTPLYIVNTTTEDVLGKMAQLNLRTNRISTKFTVNGGINSTQGLFFVKPDNSVLVNWIKDGAYIMLTGHRGSGKTTRCWYSINNELLEYDTICTTLQGVNADTPKMFWLSYGAQIKMECEGTSLQWEQDIIDASSFQNFFKHHRGKKIVLFIDEFDFLLAHEKVLEQLYDALRGIKDKRTSKYGLQSLIAVGPHNISRYSNQQLSPFNATYHWEVPYFTRSEVDLLFADFTNTRGLILDVGIVDSIYDITMGHPGMTCFCGKAIQDKLLLNKTSLSLDEWMYYETFELRNDICSNWRTVDALNAKVREDKFAKFLTMYVLSTSNSMPYDCDDIIQLELIGLGALAKRGDRVEVPSPLVRAILLKSVTSKNQQKSLNLLPVNKDFLLDVPTLMRSATCFDANQMRNAPKVSAKKNETPRADVTAGEAVPHEDVYRVQLHQFLAANLPPTFTKETGMNGPDNSRPDIVVSNSDNKRVVVEVVAHERDGPEDRRGSVEEHIKRCNEQYIKINGVQEAWVVNFTTRQPVGDLDTRYIWSKYSKVKIIHVWHDLDWTKAKITRKNGKNHKKHKYVTVELNLRE